MVRNVRGAAVLIALLSLAVVAGAAAHPQSTELALAPRGCGAVHGPKWTQTINVANSPKQKAQLRVIEGTRYNVFVDLLPCARTRRIVSRLIRIRIPWRLRAASPAGYECQAGDNSWFRDHNGDNVRHSEPVTAYGACVIPEAAGFTIHTFWWSPAKPQAQPS